MAFAGVRAFAVPVAWRCLLSIRLSLMAAAAVFVAAPAFAQTTDTAPAAPTAPAQTAPATDAEAELRVASEAFQGRMEAMAAELAPVVAAAGTDAAKARTDTDPILARYQAEAQTFADKVGAFVTAQAALEGAEAQTEAAQFLPMIQQRIQGVPAQIRDQMIAEATAPTADPATPAPPAAD